MIPIFRAKKLDSDEYVKGWYSSPILISGKLYVSITNTDGEFSIDTTTLSIHFPDMIDIKGDKFFASLQEDGKGGDIIEYNGKKEVVKYSIGTIQTYMFRFEDLIDLTIKVTGIKE